MRRIRTEFGVREYLDTFYLPDPTYPPTWIQQSDTLSRQTTKQHNASATSLSDQQLLAQHRLLSLVDEREAGRWHWRDGRKVKRGLERWWENVEALRRESEGKGGEAEHAGEEVREPSRTRCVIMPCCLDVANRFNRLRTLMFWVYDDLEKLAPRLDRRVDKMVDVSIIIS